MASAKTIAAAIRRRPAPPADLQRFTPAPEIATWVQETILAADGALHNPEHSHLIDADVAFLWAPGGFTSKMRTVLGTTEQVAFRCNAWQRDRQEQQMRDWFGGVPEWLITLDAHYCAACPDVAFCALVEHELCHIAHKLDDFKQPMFTVEGRPKLTLRGHDVEEFVGVVRRYGAGDPDSSVSRMVAAARQAPEVSLAQIARACGTCLRAA